MDKNDLMKDLAITTKMTASAFMLKTLPLLPNQICSCCRPIQGNPFLLPCSKGHSRITNKHANKKGKF